MFHLLVIRLFVTEIISLLYSHLSYSFIVIPNVNCFCNYTAPLSLAAQCIVIGPVCLQRVGGRADGRRSWRAGGRCLLPR